MSLVRFLVVTAGIILAASSAVADTEALSDDQLVEDFLEADSRDGDMFRGNSSAVHQNDCSYFIGICREACRICNQALIASGGGHNGATEVCLTAGRICEFPGGFSTGE